MYLLYILNITILKKNLKLTYGGNKKNNNINILDKLNNNDIDNINNFIKKNKKYLQILYKDIYNNNNNNIYYKYDHMKNRIPYDTFNYLNFNCHLGQRKLLLTEIEFYNKFYNNNNKTLVIYAGSASCEHLPVVRKYYSKLKFILIDPNYHKLGTKNSKYKYIYQNKEVISEENRKRFKSNLKNSFINKNSINRIKYLQKMRFLYMNNEIHDTLTYGG